MEAKQGLYSALREGLWQGLNAAAGVSDTILKYEDCSGHGIFSINRVMYPTCRGRGAERA
jgi:hypothetical protein